MNVGEALAFSTRDELDAWLASHHVTSGEIWVRIFNKQPDTPSVSWNDCVVTSIASG